MIRHDDPRMQCDESSIGVVAHQVQECISGDGIGEPVAASVAGEGEEVGRGDVGLLESWSALGHAARLRSFGAGS